MSITQNGNLFVAKKTLGFAAQQDVTPHYTLKDLSMGSVKSSYTYPFSNSVMYSNADGNSSWLDTLNNALGAFTTTSSAQSQQAIDAAVLAHDQNQLLLAQQQAAASAAKTKQNIIVLSVVAVIAVGGFIVYRKFKK